MEFHVLLGHSGDDPEKHCFDGDSTYITGSFENTLVRLLGVDAAEVRGLDLYSLRKSGFFNTLEYQLRKHLEPKLTDRSIQIHKDLGFQTKDYFNSILEEELVMTFEKEVFDRYGRALVYLSAEDCNTYNYRLVEAGYAVPYFVYPNAVSPTEEGEWNYDTISKMREVTLQAVEKETGFWKYADDILLPMELRFLTRRELPLKYCADLKSGLLYSPQYYFKVYIEDRLFFYPIDVLAAILKGFRPTTDCEE